MLSILATPVVAKDICPAPLSDADPLHIREADITYERYVEAVEFLKHGLKEAIQRNSTLEQFQEDMSFGIQYTNAIRALEGYALKQRALAEGDIEHVEQFCEFLRATKWSD